MFDETFSKQGCLVIDRLFHPSLIDSVREEYERQYESFDCDNLPLHMNVGDKRLHLPIQLRGPLLEENLYAHPLLMRMLANLLQTSFLIDNVNCVTALPGASAQKFHRDHSVLFAEQDGLAVTLPPFAITLAIPLIDLNPMTGTTMLFPNSMGAMAGANEDHPLFAEELCPFVHRGGCFLMDYRLWHRGMANRSDRDRPILYIVYAREWFTDVVNFRKHSRMIIDPTDFARISTEHMPMFRRIAAKGLHDVSIEELTGAI